STLKRPLLSGRDFTLGDATGSNKVAIVSAGFANHFFGGPQQALGHLFGIGGGKDTKLDTQIVGVVQDAKHEGVREEIRRSMFIPFLQTADAGQWPLQFYLRTWQDPQAAEAGVRAALQKLDSKLVLDTLQTMDDQIDDNLSTERIIALLATSFGVLATLLAAV